MIEDQKYFCMADLGAEILVFITSIIILISLMLLVLPEIFPKFRILKNYKIRSKHDTNLFLYSAYALFLPLMSYMFSQAKKYDPERRAQVILAWMVFIEIFRMRSDPICTWKLRKSLEQLVRLLWVGFLVYNYAPLQGIRANLFVLCIYFAFSEVIKGIAFNKAKNSYLIGKNPKLIHNYVKRVMLQDDLKTTPMNSCDYIVMGEENHEIAVCSNGFVLGEIKSNSESMLTIGRVFQLNSEDEGFTSPHPNLRDSCLSLALAKMLRRRFAKLPIDEAGCRKALDFVLEGLIDYIGNNRDIQATGSNFQSNPIDRVFRIIEDELKYVSEFLLIRVPTYRLFCWYLTFDYIGFVMLIGSAFYIVSATLKRYSAWLSLVEKEAYSSCFFLGLKHGYGGRFFLNVDLLITYLLIIACVYIQMTGVMTALRSTSNKILSGHSNYRTNVLLKSQRVNVKGAKVYSSILNSKTEIIFLCVRVDVSILACLPKWIRRIIPRSSPPVIHNTDVKEAIIESLKNSGGRLSNGETSLKTYGMEHLNWACQPNGSTTEAILIWHIATTIFLHQGPSTQQNFVPLQEPAPQQSTNPCKEEEVALALSNYCHYLVAYLPELLPDEVECTEEKYESVTKEILDIPQPSDQKLMEKNRCSYALQAIWGESSVVGKGAKLAKDLMNCAEDGSHVCKMLADFWAEMMLFIAPSDNVDGHEKILDGEELITQLWALLTHAGIVTRPNPTEHHDNESESNAFIGNMNV